MVLSMHGSATESGLREYSHRDGIYATDASSIVQEHSKECEAKEPRVTPCR
jgi:hypothetical protein